VTAGDREPLRIALVHHSSGSDAAELAGALRASGHHAEILSPQSGGSLCVVEKALRYRGFATPLTQVPSGVAALRGGSFHVAQAFSPQDATAALLWRRLGGGPVVFSPAEPLRRETMADRRLSLRLLERAIEDSDAVVAPTEESRAALWRWLSLDVPLLDPSDTAGYERLYRSLLESRG
jgi:glycosyl transferase family 4